MQGGSFKPPPLPSASSRDGDRRAGQSADHFKPDSFFEHASGSHACATPVSLRTCVTGFAPHFSIRDPAERSRLTFLSAD
jgi:hypothetical protein